MVSDVNLHPYNKALETTAELTVQVPFVAAHAYTAGYRSQPLVPTPPPPANADAWLAAAGNGRMLPSGER